MVDLREGLENTLGAGYSVERELAGGGMSRVFIAFDRALGRRVVVKVLPAEFAASVSVERFKREIMLAATLQHPHIVGVLSAGQIFDGVPYYTMPFVEGETLRARIQREGQLPVGRAVSILKDVARALAYAHDRGVVHRDIKPDNVLLAGTSATVTDFGIAKALLGSITGEAAPSTGAGGVARSGLTAMGTTLGTPAYMAPEQAAADPGMDHRADIYSFGIMAYEMLTGQVPFRSATPQALLAAQLTAPPPPIPSRRSDVPVALTNLVMACLEKDPARRPQSAQQVAEMLEHPDMVSGAFASAPTIAVRSRRPLVLTLIAAAAIVGLSTLAVIGVRERRAAAARVATARDSAQAVANDRARSIAVLPFVNIGRDSADEYLADGLTNDLINALAKVPGLRVTSLSAAKSARARFTSSAEIAQALNAGRILEGTVQRDGRRLRVTARVSNAADGFMVWSDMFEREITDVFSVQDEISGSIARVLGTRMASVQAVARARGTTDDAAHDLYLRGRYFLEKRGTSALYRALDLYKQATVRDTGYAAAYAGIAQVYGVLAIYGASATALDTLTSKGLDAATRAIRLDSTSAEAYAARANLLGNEWRWNDAEGDFQRALALDPKYASAEEWYGEQLLMRGRTTEAIAHLATAASLNPVSPVVASSYSLALGIAHRDHDAVAQARRAIELDSTFFLPRLVLGMDHLFAGRDSQAVAELEQALGLGPSPLVRGALGYAYAIAGQVPNANAMLKQLATDHSANAPAGQALVRLAEGDTAQALGDLERAAAQHAPFFSSFPLSAPTFDPIRASARFQELRRTLRLP